MKTTAKQRYEVRQAYVGGKDIGWCVWDNQVDLQYGGAFDPSFKSHAERLATQLNAEPYNKPPGVK